MYIGLYLSTASIGYIESKLNQIHPLVARLIQGQFISSRLKPDVKPEVTQEFTICFEMRAKQRPEVKPEVTHGQEVDHSWWINSSIS